jgi:hypothetical protein
MRFSSSRCLEAARGVGTIRELVQVMTSLSAQATTSGSEQDLRPRARTLSWMASLSIAAGELRAAEGYLLELLAWCAFENHRWDSDTSDGEL